MAEEQTSTPAPAPVSLNGPRALFAQAWSLYKTKFKLFAGILLVPLLLGVLSNIINPNYLIYNSWNPFWALAQLVVSVLFILAMVWGQASLIYALSRRNEELGVDEAYGQSKTFFWRYLGVLLLNAFIIVGGFFLFVIPGIYFMFLFIFALFILVAEGERGIMNCLLKSREYVRGRWWGVLGRYLAVAIPALIVFSIINGVAVLIGSDMAWVSLVSALSSLLVVPFLVSYFFLFYENLKAVKGEVSVPADNFNRWIYLIIAAAGYLLFAILLALGVFFTVLGFLLGWLFGNGGLETGDFLNNLPTNSI